MSEFWERHWLEVAQSMSRFSRDPSTRVGAVIVNPSNEPVSYGCNRFPLKVQETFDRLGERDIKLRLMRHAELVAIFNAQKKAQSVAGCRLYIHVAKIDGVILGGPPCLRCVTDIIEAGIIEVVSRKKNYTGARWLEDANHPDLGRELLLEAGINYRTID